MKRILSDKFKISIVVVLVVLVPYFILGPLEIYNSNQKDFEFTARDFFWIFIAFSILGCLIYGMIMSIIPDKIVKWINTIVFGLGLVSYIQYMFLNGQLSNADGTKMNWDDVGTYRYVNLLIWILILIIICIANILIKKSWDKVMLTVSIILVLMQLVGVVSLVGTTDMSGTRGGMLQTSGEKEFKVAKDENIIIFMMDCFGTQRINQALDTNSDILNFLNDFTWYENADSHYQPTFPSITHMLTGVDFDFNKESYQWMKDAWSSERTKAFYGYLKDEGYERLLFNRASAYVFGGVENLKYSFYNLEECNIDINNKWLLTLMAKYSAYRYVPYILKPYFEVLTSDFEKAYHVQVDYQTIIENYEYLSELNKQGINTMDDVSKAFIVEYTVGAHSPYNTDQMGNYDANATEPDTVLGCIHILDRYIEELKKSGVYENATIILTTDHGSSKDNAQPIFFVKRAGEQHEEMQISHAPISFDDLQATVVDVIGGDYSQFGTSIYDWNDEDTRERSLYQRCYIDGMPEVPGLREANAYRKYTYYTDGEELIKKWEEGPDEILPATPWDPNNGPLK